MKNKSNIYFIVFWSLVFVFQVIEPLRYNFDIEKNIIFILFDEFTGFSTNKLLTYYIHSPETNTIDIITLSINCLICFIMLCINIFIVKSISIKANFIYIIYFYVISAIQSIFETLINIYCPSEFYLFKVALFVINASWIYILWLKIIKYFNIISKNRNF